MLIKLNLKIPKMSKKLKKTQWQLVDAELTTRWRILPLLSKKDLQLLWLAVKELSILQTPTDLMLAWEYLWKGKIQNLGLF